MGNLIYSEDRQTSTERSFTSRDCDYATDIPLDCFVVSLLAMTIVGRAAWLSDFLAIRPSGFLFLTVSTVFKKAEQAFKPGVGVLVDLLGHRVIHEGITFMSDKSAGIGNLGNVTILISAVRISSELVIGFIAG